MAPCACPGPRSGVLITIRKGHVGKWPRTWLKLTPEGRAAFNDHLATLREIVETPTNAST